MFRIRQTQPRTVIAKTLRWIDIERLLAGEDCLVGLRSPVLLPLAGSQGLAMVQRSERFTASRPALVRVRRFRIEALMVL